MHIIASLLFPDGRKLTSALVVASQTMDARLDENQTILAVLVLAVAFQMLSHGHGFLDQTIHVFRDLGSQTYTYVILHAGTHTNPTVCTQQTHHLVTSQKSDLANSMSITQHGTNLAGSESLLGQLADELSGLVAASLEPGWGATAVGQTAAGDALSTRTQIYV